MKRLSALILGAALAGAASLYLYGAAPSGLPAGIRGPLAGIAHVLHAAPRPWAHAATHPLGGPTPAPTPARVTITALRPATDRVTLPAAWAERGSVASIWRSGFGPCGMAWSVRAGGVWMTAGHVIASCGTRDLRLRPWGATWSVPARVYATDYPGDLAILTAWRLPRPALPLVAGNPVTALVGVYNDAALTGAAPSGLRIGLDTGAGSTIATGVPGDPYTLDDAVTLAFRSLPGMSGGPVLDNAGQVVGLVSAGAGGTTWAVSAAQIRAWAPWVR